MIRNQILQALRVAMEGSRQVKITFIPEGLGYVPYLLGFALPSIGMIKLGEDELVIRAIVASHNWDGDKNRTTTITLTDKFNENWFAGRFQHALEKIEVV